MMKIIKPDYYDEFMCIAGECPFNCCHDWKITVDKDTKKKWHSLAINTNNVLEEDSDSIRLKPNGDCPFLDENRLCLIVKEYGERAISHTCHTFPRESHGFKERIELSLTVGCPVALDLLWSKENFSLIEESSCDLGMSNSNTTCTTNHLFFRIREEFGNLM